MAYVHSRDSVFKIDNAAGSLTEITSHTSSIALPRELEQADVTVLGDVDRKTIPGFQGATIALTGLVDYADDQIFDILATAVGSTTTRSWEYGPEGTASGKVKLTGEAIVTSHELSLDFGQPQSWTVALRVDGAVTESTYA